MLKVATVSPNEPYREYKDVERVYSGSTEIDKILDKNGNVLFAVNKEVEGTPALAYKGKEETNLKNYRIYGQTVDGESVGDRTGNLFDARAVSTINGYIDNAYIDQLGHPISENAYAVSEYIFIPEGANMISMNVPTILYNPAICFYGNDKTYISGAKYNYRSVVAESIPIGAKYLRFTVIKQYADTIMLSLGSTPLPYEPYGYKVPVKVEGKNLLQNPVTSQTINGVTFTVDSYGSVTCNGTATAHASLIRGIGKIPVGIYKLSGCPKNGAYNTYRLDVRNSSDAVIQYNSDYVLDTGNGHLFNSTDAHHIEIRIENGYTCNNITFYPMIRKADIEDDTYEPYRTPVTTPIYLPEPIKMVGDEAEYVDYGEQKMHRVRKNYLQSSDFEAGAIFTGEPYKNRSYQNSKTPPDLLDYNSTRKRSTNLITIIGTYTISIADGWEFGIVTFSNDRNPGELFTYSAEPVTISNCTFALQLRKTDISDISSADISDYKIMLNKGSTALPYEPYIENTDLDVTLPALPTLSGTNTLTVGTEVQPSNVYLKGRIKEIA